MLFLITLYNDFIHNAHRFLNQEFKNKRIKLMFSRSKSIRENPAYRIWCAFLTFFISVNLILPSGIAYAQLIPSPMIQLPAVGTMLNPSAGYVPLLLKGVTINPDNPLELNFIIDTGDTKLEGEALRDESLKVIKYFFAALTVPQDDMWVNLSPYEADRIVPEVFGQTEMGRDMLAQDYLLKQLTASLMFPDEKVGKEFWGRVYSKAQQLYGRTDLPFNTFNKVWIMPKKAVVYESGKSAFMTEGNMEVMLEKDYLAMKENVDNTAFGMASLSVEQVNQTDDLTAQMVREVLLPEIEKEVNEGKTFANLRQIYASMVMAWWYKQALKQSLLGQVYVNKNKIVGVDLEDKTEKEKIYQQYLDAFKKGAYNFIKEEYDPAKQQMIPRKYYSGGVSAVGKRLDRAVVRLPGNVRSVRTSMGKVGNQIVAKVGVVEAGGKATPQNIAAANIRSAENPIQPPPASSPVDAEELKKFIGREWTYSFELLTDIDYFLDLKKQYPQDTQIIAVFLAKLNNTLEVKDKVREVIVKGLGGLRSFANADEKDSVLYKIETIAENPVEPGSLREAAVFAVKALEKSITASSAVNGESVEDLITRLNSKEKTSRLNAIRELAIFDNNSAIELLSDRLGLELDPEVREAIFNAMDVIEGVSARPASSLLSKQHREELNKIVQPILQDKIQSIALRLEELIRQYFEVVDKETRKRIETSISVLIDDVNKFERVPVEELSVATQINDLDRFIQSPDFQSYLGKAEEVILNGRYTGRFLFAGAATRFGGPLYFIDLWQVASQEGKAKEKDGFYPLGMGPRQLIAYRMAIEQLARSKNQDVAKVLAKQKLIIHTNQEVHDQILEDFKNNNFYGFQPEHIFFIIQPALTGFRLENGQLVLDENTKAMPYGHGYNLMQLAQDDVAVQIDREGNLKSFTGQVLSQLTDDTIIVSHRINDLTKFLSTEVIGLDTLAYRLYLHDSGKNFVGELVGNPNKQKGGNVLQYFHQGQPKRFLIETLSTKGVPALDSLVEKAGKDGAPYNSFRVSNMVGQLKEIFGKMDLPYNLRFKDGYLYAELVTGDMSQLEEVDADFFLKAGEVIHDFKEIKNLDDALVYIRKQDQELMISQISDEELRLRLDRLALFGDTTKNLIKEMVDQYNAKGFRDLSDVNFYRNSLKPGDSPQARQALEEFKNMIEVRLELIRQIELSSSPIGDETGKVEAIESKTIARVLNPDEILKLAPQEEIREEYKQPVYILPGNAEPEAEITLISVGDLAKSSNRAKENIFKAGKADFYLIDQIGNILPLKNNVEVVLGRVSAANKEREHPFLWTSLSIRPSHMSITMNGSQLMIRNTTNLDRYGMGINVSFAPVSGSAFIDGSSSASSAISDVKTLLVLDTVSLPVIKALQNKGFRFEVRRYAEFMRTMDIFSSNISGIVAPAGLVESEGQDWQKSAPGVPLIGVRSGDSVESIMTRIEQEALVPVGASSAVREEGTSAAKKGGIDFNPDLLDLQIKRDGNGVPLPVQMQPISIIESQIQGIIPVIINITPITNLPMTLGFNDTGDLLAVKEDEMIF
jgi:hypothetical protein